MKVGQMDIGQDQTKDTRTKDSGIDGYRPDYTKEVRTKNSEIDGYRLGLDQGGQN